MGAVADTHAGVGTAGLSSLALMALACSDRSSSHCLEDCAGSTPQRG